MYHSTTQVDYEDASAKFLGWIVAAYSFGQLLASPFFGFWGDKRPTREPLIIALLINVIFSVLYSYCGAFQSGITGWIMLVSRALVGFSAGIYKYGYVCKTLKFCPKSALQSCDLIHTIIMYSIIVSNSIT